MEFVEFKKNIIEEFNNIDINLTENDAELYYSYMKTLLEWNKKMNLTAITDENEIILKHFVDSATINKYIKENEVVMDMGTGAGFPGIPLKILNRENNFILVDSLNKRINFLEEVKNKLKLNKIVLIHSRAEDLAKNKVYRENMDVVTSRAVANLKVLVEYMIPFVKVGGKCICMKGPNADEEIKEAKNAIEILGGEIKKVENIKLKDEIERNIIIIGKVKETPDKYPRKAGIPIKQPL